MSETPVTFQSDGRQIVGIFHLPERAAPCPAVLMLHGFTASKHETRRSFVQTARALARDGIATLRFDFRGCGDSDGEFHEMNISTMRADAEAALAWLSARNEIDPQRIGILGMSLGGLIASLFLHKHAALKTTVLWSPVTNPKRMIADRTTAATAQQISERGIADFNGWPVGLRFVQEMMAADPVAALHKAKIPLLVLHGDADATVPVSDSVTAVESLKSAGSEIVLQKIAGADHGFGSLKWLEILICETTVWFRSRL